MRSWDDDGEWRDYDPPCLADLTVDLEGPQVLGHLLGPDGEPIATLLDRRIVPFGFTKP